MEHLELTEHTANRPLVYTKVRTNPLALHSTRTRARVICVQKKLHARTLYTWLCSFSIQKKMLVIVFSYQEEKRFYSLANARNV